MTKLATLSLNDFKNIIREPLLIFLMLGPVLLLFALRWVIPFFTEILSPYLDLREFYPLIAGIVPLFVPMLIGFLTGFILLDERDEQVYLMLIVTPLAKGGYLAYRIILPTLVSLIYSIMILPFISIADIPFVSIVVVSFLAAFEAPLTALFLAGFAGNKVEGLALSKGLGIFLAIPIAGFFIGYPWKLFAGIIPFYWPINAILIGDYLKIEFWLHIFVGFIIHFFALWILIKRFKEKLG